MAARVRTVKAFGTWIASELDLPANPVRGVRADHNILWFGEELAGEEGLEPSVS